MKRGYPSMPKSSPNTDFISSNQFYPSKGGTDKPSNPSRDQSVAGLSSKGEGERRRKILNLASGSIVLPEGPMTAKSSPGLTTPETSRRRDRFSLTTCNPRKISCTGRESSGYTNCNAELSTLEQRNGE